MKTQYEPWNSDDEGAENYANPPADIMLASDYNTFAEGINEETEALTVPLPIGTGFESKPFKYSWNKKALLASSAIGLGTGFAMMPIFNDGIRSVEDYGIDIHDSTAAFGISTANTFVFYLLSRMVMTYNALNWNRAKTEQMQFDHATDKQLLAIKIGKALAVSTALLPISQLWEIELHNKEVAGTDGFDQFMAWAAFTTLPLLIQRTIQSFDPIHNLVLGEHDKIKLDSLGSKFCAIGIPLLASFARALTYAAATKNLCESMGLSKELSSATGALLGGVLSASIVGLSEYLAMKSLFKAQTTELTKKDIAIGVCALLEGIWFTLPTISTGTQAVEDWNPLVKAALFTPLLISHSAFEARVFYDAFEPKHVEDPSHTPLMLVGKDADLSYE